MKIVPGGRVGQEVGGRREAFLISVRERLRTVDVTGTHHQVSGPATGSRSVVYGYAVYTIKPAG